MAYTFTTALQVSALDSANQLSTLLKHELANVTVDYLSTFNISVGANQTVAIVVPGLVRLAGIALKSTNPFDVSLSGSPAVFTGLNSTTYFRTFNTAPVTPTHIQVKAGAAACVVEVAVFGLNAPT